MITKNLNVADIVKCTNGELILGNDKYICKNFVRDTREIEQEDVFIAIKGDNIDGNIFWEEALIKGAKVVIVDNIDFKGKNLSKYKDKVIIKVADTIKALQQIATKKREMYGKTFPVVAVTGSVGKTSTKDIIANVLSQKYKVLKTQGNYNNEIGVPLTILRLQDEDVAVVEMGMNHLGEISKLSKIAKPTISVVTNIGTSHIGNLGSRENILKAKLEILDGMEVPLVILNNDNDLLHKWYVENKNSISIKTFGMENKSDAYAQNVKLGENNSKFTCYLSGNEFEVKVPVGGFHFVLNSLCAALIGQTLQLNKEEIKLGIQGFELTKKRMEITTLKGNIKLINDSYNASYESMRVALEYLANMKKGRKIAVLGDMFELGEYSEKLHRDVGREVAKNNIDILLCCGENSKYIVEEAEKDGLSHKNIYYKNNSEEIENELKNILQPEDNVLIKASNGMKFYEIAEKLNQWEQSPLAEEVKN